MLRLRGGEGEGASTAIATLQLHVQPRVQVCRGLVCRLGCCQRPCHGHHIHHGVVDPHALLPPTSPATHPPTHQPTHQRDKWSLYWKESMATVTDNLAECQLAVAAEGAPPACPGWLGMLLPVGCLNRPWQQQQL